MSYFLFPSLLLPLPSFPSPPPSLSSTLPPLLSLLCLPSPSQITYSDTDQIVEARGILSDLMLEKGLEGKTLHRLEKVKSLLTPSTLANAPIVTKMKPMYTTMDSGVQVRECNYRVVPSAWILLCAKVTLCSCACV